MGRFLREIFTCSDKESYDRSGKQCQQLEATKISASEVESLCLGRYRELLQVCGAKGGVECAVLCCSLTNVFLSLGRGPSDV